MIAGCGCWLQGPLGMIQIEAIPPISKEHWDYRNVGDMLQEGTHKYTPLGRRTGFKIFNSQLKVCYRNLFGECLLSHLMERAISCLPLPSSETEERICWGKLLRVSGVSVFGLLRFELFCKHKLLGASYRFLQEPLINY